MPMRRGGLTHKMIMAGLRVLSSRRRAASAGRRAVCAGLLCLGAAAVFGAAGLSGLSGKSGVPTGALANGATNQTYIQLRKDILAPTLATADHPLFHTTWMGEDDDIIAHTKYGDISSRDLYLWMLMRGSSRQPYLLQAYRLARTQIDKDFLEKALHEEIDDYVFNNFVIPKLVPVTNDLPVDKTGAWKEYIYSLPGWQLMYILNVIRPKTCIMDTDRVKYLQEHPGEVTDAQKWRVRYIFMAADINSPIEEQDTVESSMRAIRERILAGQDFADAARGNSQAPSASRGGEIPPFQKGELFFVFEDTAAHLQPGETSEVFRGPGGYYLMQLIQVIPAAPPDLSDPIQAMRVDEGLSRQVLHAMYNYENSEFFLDRHPAYHYKPWDLKEDDDSIAEVGKFSLTKGQFRQFYPEIETEGLTRDDILIDAKLRNIIERETMAQIVREQGCVNDALLLRAKEFASNLRRRADFIDGLYCSLPATEKVVRNFWNENPRLFTPLAMKRVIKLTLSPASITVSPSSMIAEMTRIVSGAASSDVTEITAPASPDSTDGELKVVPVNATPAPVAPRGGASATPAAGGSQRRYTREEEEPVLPIDSKGANKGTSVGLEAVTSSGGVSGVSTLPGGVAPANAVTGVATDVYSAVPGEAANANWHSVIPLTTAPVPGPAVIGQSIPAPAIQANTKKFCMPVRDLPECFACRLHPTGVRDLIAHYQSSDFVIRYDDLGFTYVEDHPEMPLTVDKIPTGSISAPVILNNTAVSYYIEDARTLPKPDFNSVKTQAYSTYRAVTVQRQYKSEFRKAVDEANIRYTF